MMLKLVDIFGYLSVLLRAGTLVFQSLLLGGWLFLFCIARPSREIADSNGRDHALVFETTISGAPGVRLTGCVNSSVLMATAEIRISGVAGANFFIAGSVILVAALTIAATASLPGKLAGWWLALLVLIVLGASVMTNHAAARMENRVPLIILTVLHEACTGFWIGGLPFLLLGLQVTKDRPTQWYMTQRFSRLALVSVIVLVLSGLGMGLVYIRSFRSLYGTAYGVMVIAKIMMLVAMLALGGINFLLLRKYSPGEVMPRLRRLVEAEVGIGITIVLAAASLTSQPPAIDMVNDTVSLQQIVTRFAPGWPRLQSPDIAQLSTIMPGQAIAASDPSRLPTIFTSDGLPVSLRVLADMKWSEYNHHWMGVIVIAMGESLFSSSCGAILNAGHWDPAASGRRGPSQKSSSIASPRCFASHSLSSSCAFAGTRRRAVSCHSSSLFSVPRARRCC